MQSDIFDEMAINFISKKITSVSSDIRKTLAICRMAIEKWREQQEQNPSLVDKKISIQLIVKTFEEVYESPLTGYIKSCSEVIKTALTATFMEMKHTMTKSVEIHNVYPR